MIEKGVGAVETTAETFPLIFSTATRFLEFWYIEMTNETRVKIRATIAGGHERSSFRMDMFYVV